MVANKFWCDGAKLAHRGEKKELLKSALGKVESISMIQLVESKQIDRHRDFVNIYLVSKL